MKKARFALGCAIALALGTALPMAASFNVAPGDTLAVTSGNEIWKLSANDTTGGTGEFFVRPPAGGSLWGVGADNNRNVYFIYEQAPNHVIARVTASGAVQTVGTLPLPGSQFFVADYAVAASGNSYIFFRSKANSNAWMARVGTDGKAIDVQNGQEISGPFTTPPVNAGFGGSLAINSQERVLVVASKLGDDVIYDVQVGTPLVALGVLNVGDIEYASGQLWALRSSGSIARNELLQVTLPAAPQTGPLAVQSRGVYDSFAVAKEGSIILFGFLQLLRVNLETFAVDSVRTFREAQGTGGLNPSRFAVVPGEAPAPMTKVSTAIIPMAGTEPPDPVNTTTGELYEQMRPDIQLRGPLPLFLARYYASGLTRDGNVASALGTNWSHNFDWSLRTPDASTVSVVTSRGRVYTFTKSGNSFSLQSPLYVPVQLIQNASGFVFGTPLTEMIYTFNTGGRLTRIDDSRGNVLTLTYSGNNLAQVSDGIGRTLSFAYDGANHLTSVSDGPRSARYTYAGNDLVTYTDALGKTTTYAYDAGGLLRSATQPRGNIRYAQTFDSSGRVASQTSNGTNATTLSYAAASTTVTDSTSATRTHGHNTTPGGELTSAADEAGQGVQFGYDAAGRRTSITDRLGDTSRLSYHAQSSKIAERIEADGARTTFSFGSRTSSGVNLYPVTGVTYPDGTSESFVRDGNGNVTSRTDRVGKVWTFTYNSRSQLLTATNPTGGVTTSSYNADGTLATLADSDTGVTAFTYDVVRRPIRIARPDGSAMQMEYDANDRLTAITDELGRRFTYTYDANDNLSQITDPASRSAQFAYDALDRAVQITDRLGAISRRTFDQRELLATVVDRNNNTVRFTRDSRRRMTALTDAAGKAWTFGYDNEAVSNSMTNPLNQTSSRSTNKLGRTTSVSDALGNTVRLTRDSMQRVTSITDPLSRMTSLTYDSRGLLSGMTRPSVGTATYTRNDLGLIASIRDLNGETWQRLYTPMGRLQSMRDPLGRSTSYGYDNRGRLSSIAFPDGVQKTRTYDATSNLTRASFTGGPDHSYAYDSLNRLTSTTGLTIGYDAEGRPTSTVTNGVTSAATFDAGGRLTNVTYNNGAFSVRYEYDARNLLTRISDTFTNTQITFAYDDASRLIQVSRPSGVNGTYTYDAASRLIRIQDGNILDLQYTLNPDGEVTRENSLTPVEAAAGASGVPSATHTYDAASQIASGGYASDARGRLTNSPGHTYRWDGVSRLVGIDNINLTYDGLGNILSSGTTSYFYNVALGGNPILAEGSGTTMTRAYVWTPGGALVYSIDIATRTVAHYHFDRIGSTVAITDNSGAVTNAYAYDPYGVLRGRTGSSTQPFTWVGRWGVRIEPAAGLYHMRARYYDPSTARFLSKDPVASLAPQEINPYQYARTAPTTWIDPSGTYSVFEVFGRTTTSGLMRPYVPRNQGGAWIPGDSRRERFYEFGGDWRRAVENPDFKSGYDSGIRYYLFPGQLEKAAYYLTGVPLPTDRDLDVIEEEEARSRDEDAAEEAAREFEEQARLVNPPPFLETGTGSTEDIFAGIPIELDLYGSPKSTRESVQTYCIYNPPAQSGLADELVRAIRAGVIYANVHTNEYPGGEIRGQIQQ